MADLCNYTSEIDMDARMFGGESCIRPYAQKLRLHRAMLYAFRRSAWNPIKAGLTQKHDNILIYNRNGVSRYILLFLLALIGFRVDISR
ncbi:MAG: hypothetical protein BECKG1743D_GA0114223_104321 [Candidatus Kentron sp. G]|nr:MAG: hypothetical protein BECKG1743E_GA0114224_103911 [Candidatus Kentron sp. G]VFN03108.1 MAG: hypothetical protein BECKG1743D_GA0114223_104321 [Candidatus Kentron sp. G]